MTWSNLLSGFIGALVGGVFSIIATSMNFRHEQSQKRQSASRTASNAIVENILVISKAMLDTQWTIDHSNNSSDPIIYSSLETVQAAAQRILYVHNVLIANEKLRSRISDLIDMVEVWYTNARESPATVSQQRIKSIESYMEYVNQSIQAHLRDLPLPPHNSPPDLRAMGNS